MLFNSFEFLIFFPIVTIIYFLLPYRFRWFHLLASSCVFYMAFIPIYIVILFSTIVIDYIAGVLIEDAVGNRKRLLLSMSIVANVGVLAVFKYYNFIAININDLIHFGTSSVSLPMLSIILPIGLSFHTFQAMSYTIEVYRGNQKAERHFGIYSLYVMFYPQLVAGPIERPQHMLHQFHEKYDFNFDECKEGLKIMIWGLFKKIVIADRLALIVNSVYKHPENYSGPSILIAVVFFSFQIYCDFSGYSDIAIGSAKVMGFKLMQNFDNPYSSKSMAEFWTRWHISLSTWFKDYLYIPLGGNRVSKEKVYRNLAIVFVVSGLWHGASWTFIIWGAIHAFFLIFGLVTKQWRINSLSVVGIAEKSKVNHAMSVITTFILATFAWILFRSATFHDAVYIITHLTTGFSKLTSISGVKSVFAEVGGNDLIYGVFNVLTGVFVILMLTVLQKKFHYNSVSTVVAHKPLILRWGFQILLIVAILLIGVYEEQEFIYFQF
jgi:alginate O-acetyltransferase complex protein AlgI